MSQDFGPDLYVGSRSSALLNNITFTELTSEQEGAPPGERARIAVYNGETSTVFSRSGGEPGQTGGGEEVGAAVFERGNDISSTTTTQAVPGNLLARFPSLQDPEYIAIIQVGFLSHMMHNHLVLPSCVTEDVQSAYFRYSSVLVQQ